MSLHIAQSARNNELPSGPCRACDKAAVRRGQMICRHGAPLNGADAAAEFVRNLSPRALRIIGATA